MIKIFKPCDFHVHLREGDLAKQVLAENNKHFQKILIMPNLNIPVTCPKLIALPSPSCPAQFPN